MMASGAHSLELRSILEAGSRLSRASSLNAGRISKSNTGDASATKESKHLPVLALSKPGDTVLDGVTGTLNKNKKKKITALAATTAVVHRERKHI